MSDSPAGPRSQEPKTASASNSRRAISGHREHDKWIIALCNVGGSMAPLDFRTAIGISTYFNCTTGQCNPGYTKLAKRVGATRDSVKRACRNLENDGWIKRHRSAGGGHEDTTEFDLLLPHQRVSTPDTRGDQGRVSKSAATGVQKGRGRVSIADSLMNTENTEGAPNGAHTCYADRGDAANIDTARIFDALEDTYPMDFYDSTAASKRILAKLLKEGADPAEIITAAKAYGDHLSQNGGDTLPMDVWLERRSWEKGNGPCQEEPAERSLSRSSSSSSTTVPTKTTSSPVQQHMPGRSSAPARDRSP